MTIQLQICRPLVLATSLIVPGQAQILVDDFNDGDSVGWTENVTLQPVGGTGSFTFPDGGYRLQANASPNPAAFGTARMGAFRADASYSDFRIVVDLVDFGTVNAQDIGILARVSSPGLGSLNGYLWSYDTRAEAIFLTRLDGESPTSLGSADVSLVPGRSYRLVFQGFGNSLRGDLFDPDDLETPLVTVIREDAAHESGFGGVFNNSIEATGVTDATFDNYSSSPLSDIDNDRLPDRWEFDSFGGLSFSASDDNDGDGQNNLEEFIGGSDPTNTSSRSGPNAIVVIDGSLQVSFPVTPNRRYLLETSTTLDVTAWTPQPAAAFSEDGGIGTLSFPTGGQPVLFGRLVTMVE